MAKARKEKTAPASTESKPAAPKAPAKSKKPTKPAGPAAPMIDTSLAAQAAAKMVANRDLLSPRGTGEKRQSGSFKQLKEQMLKPTTQGPGGILQPKDARKKFNPILGGRNQVGHNQTFGADVNRTGVPRRTGG